MLLMDGGEVWRFKATHGVPLDVVFMRLAQEGYVPIWTELFAAAKADGANIPKLIQECMFYVKEAYSTEDAKEINRRLALL